MTDREGASAMQIVGRKDGRFLGVGRELALGPQTGKYEI